MKAPDFDYARPETLDAALSLLADNAGSAELLAGGQSLMPMMNFRIAAPETLIDLNGVAELSNIRIEDGHLVIGAMTRYRDLEASDDVAKAAPLIMRALPHIAHAAIRNRGTIGGSVALADPAAEMPAVLRVLGGEIVLRSAGAERVVAADDFFLGIYETARDETELVTSIQIPVAAPDQRIGFHEIVRRHGDYAMAGCACVAAGDLSTVRAAFFGVADRAIRVPEVETALAGPGIDAGVAALGGVEFEGDMNAAPNTKRHLAGVALRRAWDEVTA